MNKVLIRFNNFQCTMCPRDFNQKNSLDMHLRRHTGYKPHVCQFCNIGFTQSGKKRFLLFSVTIGNVRFIILINTYGSY